MSPIRPEMKHLYPPKAVWNGIRQRILNRAQHACELCGLKNGITGFRDGRGIFHRTDLPTKSALWALLRYVGDAGATFKIVLTIAHLDHDPTNNADLNLAALCQQCHNRLDAPMRAAGRKERARGASGQMALSADAASAEADS